MMLKKHPDVLLIESDKHDGNLSLTWGAETEVIANRKAFLAKHDLSLGQCVVMAAEHKDAVVQIDKSSLSPDTTATIPAEAFITQTKGVALFLLTADCLPITVYDPAHNALALAHLGWKPTELRLIEKVVQELTDRFGSKPADLLVHIGPGIHKESYKKDREKLTEAEQVMNTKEWRPHLTELPSGEVSIDLVAFNIAQLAEVGVQPEQVSVDPTDTAVSDRYFSHYRSVRTGEPEGRFATVAALK